MNVISISLQHITVTYDLAYTNKSLMVGGGRNQVQCHFDNPAGFGQVCAVNIEKNFGPCSESHGFGYNKSAPCIYLKLNKVIEVYSNVYSFHQ